MSICLIFIDTSLYAQVISTTSQTPKFSAPQISIPAKLGSVEESYGGSTRKTVLYIQDAHDSLEAQKHIAGMIRHLVGRHQVRTVYEEGFQGPVPTDRFFGVISDAGLREKVAYFLMDQLRIGGAEYAHINRKRDFRLIGADSINLHFKNIAWYQENARHQDETRRDLAVLGREIRKLSQQYMPKEIKEWMRLKERLGDNRLGLIDYLKRMRERFGMANSKSFATKYPVAALLLDTDQAKDPQTAEKAKTLDARKLFTDIDRLENDYAELFLNHRRDRKIFEFIRGLQLIGRLSEVQITHDEFEATKNHLLRLRTENLARFIVRYADKPVVFSKKWEQNIRSAVRFYEVAEARNHSIEQRLNEFLSNPAEENAVLVFGGFHKSAIKKILQRKGLSYQILTPRIRAADERHRDLYKRLMSVGYHAFEVPFNLSIAARVINVFEQARQFSDAAVGTELAAIAQAARGKELDREILISEIITILTGKKAAGKIKPSVPASESQKKPGTISAAVANVPTVGKFESISTRLRAQAGRSFAQSRTAAVRLGLSALVGFGSGLVSSRAPVGSNEGSELRLLAPGQTARGEARSDGLETKYAEAMKLIGRMAAHAEGDLHAIHEQFQDKTISPPPVYRDDSIISAVGNQIFIGRQANLDSQRLADYLVRLKKIMLLLPAQIALVGNLPPTPQKGPTIKALAELCRLEIAIAEGNQVRANKDRITLGIDVIALDLPARDQALIKGLFQGRAVMAEAQRKFAERKQKALAALEAIDKKADARRQAKTTPALDLTGQSLFIARLGDFADHLAKLSQPLSDKDRYLLPLMLDEIVEFATGFETAQTLDFSSFLARRYGTTLGKNGIKFRDVEEFIRIHEGNQSVEALRETGYGALQAARISKSFASLKDPVSPMLRLVTDLREYAVSVSLATAPSLIRPTVDWLSERVLAAASAREAGLARQEWMRIESFLAGVFGTSRAFPAGVLQEVEATYLQSDAMLKEKPAKKILAHAFALGLLLRAGESLEEDQKPSLIHAEKVVLSVLELFRAAKQLPPEEICAKLLSAAWLDGIAEDGIRGSWARVQMRSEGRVDQRAVAERIRQLVQFQVSPDIAAVLRGKTTSQTFNLARERAAARDLLQARVTAAMELMLRNVERLNLRARATALKPDQAESPEADTLLDMYNLLNHSLSGFPEVQIDIPDPGAKVTLPTPKMPFVILKAGEGAQGPKIALAIHAQMPADVFASHLLQLAMHLQNRHRPEAERVNDREMRQATEKILTATNRMKLADEPLTEDERDAEAIDLIMDGAPPMVAQQLMALGIEIVLDEETGRADELAFYLPQATQRDQIVKFLSGSSFERALSAVLAAGLPSRNLLDESVREQMFKRQGRPAPSVSVIEQVRARLAREETVADQPDAVALIKASDRKREDIEALLPAVAEAMQTVRDCVVRELKQAGPDNNGEIKTRVDRAKMIEAIDAGRLSALTGIEERIRAILGNDLFKNPKLNDPVEILIMVLQREAGKSEELRLSRAFKKLVYSLKRYFDQPMSRWQFWARSLTAELENEHVVKQNDLSELTAFLCRLVMTYTMVLSMRKGLALEQMAADPATVREALEAVAEDIGVYFNAGGQLGRKGDDTFKAVVIEAAKAIDLARFPPYLRQAVITQYLPGRLERMEVTRQAAQRVQEQAKTQRVDPALNAALAQTLKLGAAGAAVGLLGGSTAPGKKAVALLTGNVTPAPEFTALDAAEAVRQHIDVKKFSPALPSENRSYWLVERNLIDDVLKAFRDAGQLPSVAADAAPQADQPSVLDRLAEHYPASWGQNMEQALAEINTPTARQDGLQLDEFSEWLIYMLKLYYWREGWSKFGKIQQAFTAFRKNTQIISDDEIAALLSEVNTGREAPDQLKEEDAVTIIFLFCMFYSLIRQAEMQSDTKKAKTVRAAFAEKLPLLGVNVPIFNVVSSYLQNYAGAGAAGEAAELSQAAQEEKKAQEALDQFAQALRQAETVGGELARNSPEAFLARAGTFRHAISQIFRFGSREQPRTLVRMLFSGESEPRAEETEKIGDRYRAISQMTRGVMTGESAPEIPHYRVVFEFAESAFQYVTSNQVGRILELREALAAMLPKFFAAIDNLDQLREAKRQEEAARPQRELAEKLEGVKTALEAGPAAAGAGASEEQLEKLLAKSPVLSAMDKRLAAMQKLLEEALALLRSQRGVPAPAENQPAAGADTLAGGVLETQAGQAEENLPGNVFEIQMSGSDQLVRATVSTLRLSDLVRPDETDQYPYLQLVFHNRLPDTIEAFRIYGNSIRYRNVTEDGSWRELNPTRDGALLAISELNYFVELFYREQATEVRHIRFEHPDLNEPDREVISLPNGQFYAVVNGPDSALQGVHLYEGGFPESLGALVAQTLPARQKGAGQSVGGVIRLPRSESRKTDLLEKLTPGQRAKYGEDLRALNRKIVTYGIFMASVACLAWLLGGWPFALAAVMPAFIRHFGVFLAAGFVKLSGLWTGKKAMREIVFHPTAYRWFYGVPEHEFSLSKSQADWLDRAGGLASAAASLVAVVFFAAAILNPGTTWTALFAFGLFTLLNLNAAVIHLGRPASGDAGILSMLRVREYPKLIPMIWNALTTSEDAGRLRFRRDAYRLANQFQNKHPEYIKQIVNVHAEDPDQIYVLTDRGVFLIESEEYKDTQNTVITTRMFGIISVPVTIKKGPVIKSRNVPSTIWTKEGVVYRLYRMPDFPPYLRGETPAPNPRPVHRTQFRRDESSEAKPEVPSETPPVEPEVLPPQPKGPTSEEKIQAALAEFDTGIKTKSAVEGQPDLVDFAESRINLAMSGTATDEGMLQSMTLSQIRNHVSDYRRQAEQLIADIRQKHGLKAGEGSRILNDARDRAVRQFESDLTAARKLFLEDQKQKAEDLKTALEALKLDLERRKTGFTGREALNGDSQVVSLRVLLAAASIADVQKEKDSVRAGLEKFLDELWERERVRREGEAQLAQIAEDERVVAEVKALRKILRKLRKDLENRLDEFQNREQLDEDPQTVEFFKALEKARIPDAKQAQLRQDLKVLLDQLWGAPAQEEVAEEEFLPPESKRERPASDRVGEDPWEAWAVAKLGEAKRVIRDRQYDVALDIYREIIGHSEVPGEKRAQALLGASTALTKLVKGTKDLDQRRNCYSEAFSFCEMVVRDRRLPLDLRSHGVLSGAVILSNEKLYAEAIEYLDQGLNDDPQNFYLLTQKAWTFLYWGADEGLRDKFDEAIAIADSILARHPDLTAALKVKIASMLHREDPAGEIEHVLSAAEAYGRPDEFAGYRDYLEEYKRERSEARNMGTVPNGTHFPERAVESVPSGTVPEMDDRSEVRLNLPAGRAGDGSMQNLSPKDVLDKLVKEFASLLTGEKPMDENQASIYPLAIGINALLTEHPELNTPSFVEKIKAILAKQSPQVRIRYSFESGYITGKLGYAQGDVLYLYEALLGTIGFIRNAFAFVFKGPNVLEERFRALVAGQPSQKAVRFASVSSEILIDDVELKAALLDLIILSRWIPRFVFGNGQSPYDAAVQNKGIIENAAQALVQIVRLYPDLLNDAIIAEFGIALMGTGYEVRGGRIVPSEARQEARKIPAQKIVFFTYIHQYGIPAIKKTLQSKRHQVAGIVTFRSNHEIIRFARDKHIPIYYAPDELDEAEVNERMETDADFAAKMTRLLARLREIRPDIAVTFGFPVLPGELIGLPAKKFLNVHPTALPRLRGRFPLVRSILDDEKTIGVTVHELSAKTDGGDIVNQALGIKIGPRDTMTSLVRKTAPVAAQLLLASIDQIAMGRAALKPQRGPAALPAFSQSLVGGVPLVETSLIDWNLPSQTIARRVRAWHFFNEGRAQTRIRGKEVDVERIRILKGFNTNQSLKPGKIVKQINGSSFIVKTGDGFVRIQLVVKADVRPLLKAGRSFDKVGVSERAEARRAEGSQILRFAQDDIMTQPKQVSGPGAAVFGPNFRSEARISAVSPKGPYKVILQHLAPDVWRTESPKGSYQYEVIEASPDTPVGYQQELIALRGNPDIGNLLPSVGEIEDYFSEDSDLTTTLLISNGELAGFCVFLPSTKQLHSRGILARYLQAIYVLPKYRTTGAADVLLEDIKHRIYGDELNPKFNYEIIRSEHPEAKLGAGYGTMEQFKKDLGMRSIVEFQDDTQSAISKALMPGGNYHEKTYPDYESLLEDLYRELFRNQDLPLPVVLVDGLPGSGKSSLARRLARLARERGVDTHPLENDWFVSRIVRNFAALLMIFAVSLVLTNERIDRVVLKYLFDVDRIKNLVSQIHAARQVFTQDLDGEAEVRPQIAFYNLQKVSETDSAVYQKVLRLKRRSVLLIEGLFSGLLYRSLLPDARRIYVDVSPGVARKRYSARNGMPHEKRSWALNFVMAFKFVFSYIRARLIKNSGDFDFRISLDRFDRPVLRMKVRKSSEPGIGSLARSEAHGVDIDKMIDQLKDPDEFSSDRAAVALFLAGEAALPALRQVLRTRKDSFQYARENAQWVIDKIEASSRSEARSIELFLLGDFPAHNTFSVMAEEIQDSLKAFKLVSSTIDKDMIRLDFGHETLAIKKIEENVMHVEHSIKNAPDGGTATLRMEFAFDHPGKKTDVGIIRTTQAAGEDQPQVVAREHMTLGENIYLKSILFKNGRVQLNFGTMDETAVEKYGELLRAFESVSQSFAVETGRLRLASVPSGPRINFDDRSDRQEIAAETRAEEPSAEFKDISNGFIGAMWLTLGVILFNVLVNTPPGLKWFQGIVIGIADLYFGIRLLRHSWALKRLKTQDPGPKTQGAGVKAKEQRPETKTGEHSETRVPWNIERTDFGENARAYVFDMPKNPTFNPGTPVMFAAFNNWVDGSADLEKEEVRNRLAEETAGAVIKFVEAYRAKHGDTAVAFISYWTSKEGTTANGHPYPLIMEKARQIVLERRPDIISTGDGTQQLDAALDIKTHEKKVYPGQPAAAVAEKMAAKKFPPRIFIFSNFHALEVAKDALAFYQSKSDSPSEPALVEAYLKKLEDMARANGKSIVLPEALNPVVLRAASKYLGKGIGRVILLGDETRIREKAQAEGIDISGAEIIDPLPQINQDWKDSCGRFFYLNFKGKPETEISDQDLRVGWRTIERQMNALKKRIAPEIEAGTMRGAEDLFYGAWMVASGRADSMIAGKDYDSGDVIFAMKMLAGLAPGIKHLSAAQLYSTPYREVGTDGAFMLADITTNQNPDDDGLVDITVNTAKSIRRLISPEVRIAFIFGKGETSEKIESAIRKARERLQSLGIDAVIADEAMTVDEALKQGYNGLIGPDLDTSNALYKSFQWLGGFTTLSLTTGGSPKAILDLSRGAGVDIIEGTMEVAVALAETTDTTEVLSERHYQSVAQTGSVRLMKAWILQVMASMGLRLNPDFTDHMGGDAQSALEGFAQWYTAPRGDVIDPIQGKAIQSLGRMQEELRGFVGHWIIGEGDLTSSFDDEAANRAMALAKSAQVSGEEGEKDYRELAALGDVTAMEAYVVRVMAEMGLRLNDAIDAAQMWGGLHGFAPWFTAKVPTQVNPKAGEMVQTLAQMRRELQTKADTAGDWVIRSEARNTVTAPRIILNINAGSSSVKYQLIDMETETVVTDPNDPERKPVQGVINDIGKPGQPTHRGAIEQILKKLPVRPDAVGHRVVLGGKFTKSRLIDREVKDEIRKFIPIAPLHNKPNLEGIEAAEELLPGVPQVAVFDTSFHANKPAKTAFYAILMAFTEKFGLKRFGFHGTSYRYILSVLQEILGKPVEQINAVIFHLGNGSSGVQVVNGVGVDTTMGIAPNEGVMMGTRSGSVPAVLLMFLAQQFAKQTKAKISERWLLRSIFGFCSLANLVLRVLSWFAARVFRVDINLRAGIDFEKTVAEVVRVLDKESGVLGVSGVNNDVYKVMQALGINEVKNPAQVRPAIDKVNAILAAPDAPARAEEQKREKNCALALQMYTHRVAHEMGAFFMSMERADAIVFTGGIGWNNAVIRQMIIDELKQELFKDRIKVYPRGSDTRESIEEWNQKLAEWIRGLETGAIPVIHLETNEEIMIARDTRQIIAEANESRNVPGTDGVEANAGGRSESRTQPANSLVPMIEAKLQQFRQSLGNRELQGAQQSLIDGALRLISVQLKTTRYDDAAKAIGGLLDQADVLGLRANERELLAAARDISSHAILTVKHLMAFVGEALFVKKQICLPDFIENPHVYVLPEIELAASLQSRRGRRDRQTTHFYLWEGRERRIIHKLGHNDKAVDLGQEFTWQNPYQLSILFHVPYSRIADPTHNVRNLTVLLQRTFPAYAVSFTVDINPTKDNPNWRAYVINMIRRSEARKQPIREISETETLESLRGQTLPEKTIVIAGALGEIGSNYYVRHLAEFAGSHHVKLIAVDQKISNREKPEGVSVNLPFGDDQYYSPDAFKKAVADGQLKPDGLIIATPPNTHMEYLRWAVKNEVPVFVEKPLAMPGEIEEARELYRGHPGLIFAVDNFFDKPGSLAAYPYMNREHLGDIVSIQGRLIENFPISPEREWLVNPEISGGGIAMDMLIHLMSPSELCLNQFGKSLKDFVFSDRDIVFGRYEGAPAGRETYARLKGQDAGSVKVDFEVGKAVQAHQSFIVIKGTKGTLKIDFGYVRGNRKSNVTFTPADGVKQAPIKVQGIPAYRQNVLKILDRVQRLGEVSQEELDLRFRAETLAVEIIARVQKLFDGHYLTYKTGERPGRRIRMARSEARVMGTDLSENRSEARLFAPIEQMPAGELLQALDLSKFQSQVQISGEGLTVHRIEIPEVSEKSRIPQGLEILVRELTPIFIREFDLLYNEKGHLIAVFPVIPGPYAERLMGQIFYFDFTKYYFEIPAIGTPDAAAKWKAFGKEVTENEKLIGAYKRERDLKIITYPTHGQTAYVYAEVDKRTGRIDVRQFDVKDFDETLNQRDVAKDQVIFPVLPTVFSPGLREHWMGDRGYHRSIYVPPADLGTERDYLKFKAGHKVLVGFAGTGFDSWLAYLALKRATGDQSAVLPIYAFDANPLAVANVRIFSRLAGFEVVAKVYDNVIKENRMPVFEGIRFDRFIGNLPSLSVEQAPTALIGLWDGGTEAMLRQLADGIVQILAPEGTTLFWNIHYRNDNVAEILRSSGKLTVDVFDTPVDETAVNATSDGSVDYFFSALLAKAQFGNFRNPGIQPAVYLVRLKSNIKGTRDEGQRERETLALRPVSLAPLPKRSEARHDIVQWPATDDIIDALERGFLSNDIELAMNAFYTLEYLKRQQPENPVWMRLAHTENPESIRQEVIRKIQGVLRAGSAADNFSTQLTAVYAAALRQGEEIRPEEYQAWVTVGLKGLDNADYMTVRHATFILLCLGVFATLANKAAGEGKPVIPVREIDKIRYRLLKMLRSGDSETAAIKRLAVIDGILSLVEFVRVPDHLAEPEDETEEPSFTEQIAGASFGPITKILRKTVAEDEPWLYQTQALILLDRLIRLNLVDNFVGTPIQGELERTRNEKIHKMDVAFVKNPGLELAEGLTHVEEMMPPQMEDTILRTLRTAMQDVADEFRQQEDHAPIYRKVLLIRDALHVFMSGRGESDMIRRLEENLKRTASDDFLKFISAYMLAVVLSDQGLEQLNPKSALRIRDLLNESIRSNDEVIATMAAEALVKFARMPIRSEARERKGTGNRVLRPKSPTRPFSLSKENNRAPHPVPRVPNLATHAPSSDIRRMLETLQGQYAVVIDMNVFEALNKEQREEFYKLFPIYDADREADRKVKFVFSAMGDRRLSPVMQEIIDFQKEYKHHVQLRVNTPSFNFGTRKIIHVTKDDIQNLSTAGFEEDWRKSGKLFEVRYRINNQQCGLITAALLLLDSGRDELFRRHSYLSEIPAGWVSAIQSFLSTYLYMGRSA